MKGDKGKVRLEKKGEKQDRIRRELVVGTSEDGEERALCLTEQTSFDLDKVCSSSMSDSIF